MNSNQDSVASLTDVSKSFKKLPVLNGVNLTVPRGALCGVQGPNGSGKSLLFKILCRLVIPDTGDVWLSPELFDGGSAFPTKIGVIIDRPGYLPNLTGLENLLELASIRKKIGRKEVLDAMERVGLPPQTKQLVRHYSLGMKQKLAIAQAFMEGQHLLLLDEVFNGLDSSSVENIRGLLKELNADGRTIVITSHNQADIEAVCDSVWRIDNGSLHPVAD